MGDRVHAAQRSNRLSLAVLYNGRAAKQILLASQEDEAWSRSARALMKALAPLDYNEQNSIE